MRERIKSWLKAGKDGVRKFWIWLTGGAPEAGRETADAAIQTAKTFHLASCGTVVSQSRHIATFILPEPVLSYFGVHIKTICAKVCAVAAKYKFVHISLSLAKVGAASTMAVGIFTGAALIAGGMILAGIILNRLCKKLPEHLAALREEIQKLKDLIAGLRGEAGAEA